MGLTEENFDEYKKTFNIVEITIGAKNKILREVDRLRQRRQNLESILSVSIPTLFLLRVLVMLEYTLLGKGKVNSTTFALGKLRTSSIASRL